LGDKKPIDRWLGFLGIVVALVLYLVPDKTPAIVVICISGMFGLLIHPVWNFWWIEARLWRKVSAIVVLAWALFRLGKISWPSKADSFSIIALSSLFGLWGWLVGDHGHWLFLLVGSLATIALTIALIVALGIFKSFSARTRRGRKGLLEHKLDVENAIPKFSAIIIGFGAAMGEVGPSIEKRSTALQGSSSTGGQLAISRLAASDLDRCTTRLRRSYGRHRKQGQLISDGLTWWSLWLQKTKAPNHDTVFRQDLAVFVNALDSANSQLLDYVATLAPIREVSAYLDSAIDRHTEQLSLILQTNTAIHAACALTVDVIDGLNGSKTEAVPMPPSSALTKPDQQSLGSTIRAD